MGQAAALAHGWEKDPMAASADRYSTVAIALHWGIAILVLLQIGLYFAADSVEGPVARTFIEVHKASGLRQQLHLLQLLLIGMPSHRSRRNLHIAQIGQISALIRVFIPLH